MSDPTLDRAQADLALEKAVQDAFNAYSSDDYPSALTGFIVLAHAQGWDGDGNAVSTYRYLLPSNDPPPHHILGLFDIIRDIYEEDINGDRSDD